MLLKAIAALPALDTMPSPHVDCHHGRQAIPLQRIVHSLQLHCKWVHLPRPGSKTYRRAQSVLPCSAICSTAVLPAPEAHAGQLASMAALSLQMPELPKLHVSPLDVLWFLLHNPPITLFAAFAVAYLVSLLSCVFCCKFWSLEPLQCDSFDAELKDLEKHSALGECCV